jgi:protein-S-isoprenylcysteine O-methyltransferase Ste14
MSYGQFVAIFLVLALAQRFYERRYSLQAERGERKMEWSYAALHMLYLAVFAGAAIEYYFWPPARICGWVTGAGLVLWTVALFVRLTAIRTLGKFWSLDLEIREKHQLVTQGIYSHVRHPAYSSIMLEMVAIPLVCNTYGTLVIAVAAYIPLLLMRWNREEREMIAKFGDRYVQYRQQVPAFVPCLCRSKKASPPGDSPVK